MRKLIAQGDVEAARLGVPRSPEWPRVERAHLALEPRCVACAAGMHANARVQVHHEFPFHLCVVLGRPDLELDDRNLVTLCEDEDGQGSENHHLLVGHLNCFGSANLSARQDAAGMWHGKTAAQLRTDVRWLQAVTARIRPLDQMSIIEKQALLAMMNKRLPKK